MHVSGSITTVEINCLRGHDNSVRRRSEPSSSLGRKWEGGSTGLLAGASTAGLIPPRVTRGHGSRALDAGIVEKLLFQTPSDRIVPQSRIDPHNGS